MVVPMQRELIFHGDEKDRVGVDANCRFAELTFRYEPQSTFHSHGIRLKTNGLTNSSDRSTDDLENWNKIFDTASKAVSVGQQIADLGSRFVGM